jgi:hypothetical protein
MILFSLDLGCMIRALSNIKHGKEHMISGTIQPGEAIIESKIAQRLGAGIPLPGES